MVAQPRTGAGLLALEVAEVEVPSYLAARSSSSMAVYGAWEIVEETSVKRQSLATFDGSSSLHEVPFDPMIIMIHLVRDESDQISKYVFQDKLSKL